MVRKICVDSDILIEILRGNPKVNALINSLDAEFCITSVNLYEIWGGRQKSETIKPFLDKFEVLDFNEEEAYVAGDLRIDLRKKGEIIEVRDIFIASVCIANNVELLTLNKKHFERMKSFGLKLVQ